MANQLQEIAASRASGTASRWFTSDKLDLFVWPTQGSRASGDRAELDHADLGAFELSWRHFENETAIRWSEQDGFSVYALKGNSRHLRHSGSAIALDPSHSGPVSAQTLLRIRSAFRAAANELPNDIKTLIDNRLNELLLNTELDKNTN